MHATCRLSELLTIRATESGKTCHERWQDPTVSSYRACITHFRIVLGQVSGRLRLGGLTRQLGSLPSARRFGQCYRGLKMTRSLYLPSSLCAALLIGLPQFGIAGEFGGLPPWGREKPTHFSGEVRRGETFDQPIGGGLTISLTGGWEIQVGRSGNDYSECATGPLHGPTPKEFMAWHFQVRYRALGE